MMSFAYPGLLYLLLLIPAIAGLFVWAQLARRAKLRRFGRPEVLEPLMPDASKYKPWIKITLQLLAIAALVVVLARPRYGEKEEMEQGRGIEVMIAFDVSRSMLASSNDDPAGISRLQRAKHILEKLIDKLDNDKVGLIVFAGEAYTQLPVTGDFMSAKMYLNSLTPDMVPTQGTAIGQAISMAINGFSPNDDMRKAIVIITDGENHEGDAIDMAHQAKDRGIQVDVIGVGSGKGAPIPLNAKKGEFLKDASGQPVTTALDEQMAREIAKAGGGEYDNGSSASAVSDLCDALDKLEKSDFEKVSYKASAEQFPLFAWIALALILADVFVLDRKIGWLKKINFFTKEKK